MLSLQVVDPGTLVVEAGDEVVAAGELNWGEDNRLRVDAHGAHPPAALPRLVSREPGREEVEVDVPEGVGAGGLLTLTYEWGWKHAGKPALERTWRLPPMEEIPPEWLEDELLETQREDTPEDGEDGAPTFLPAQEASFPVQVDPERPELLWVAGYASREDIASRLFGDGAAAGAFDLEPRAPPARATEGLQVCVRVRHPPALVPELLATLRRALEARLEADAAWSRSQLPAASLDKAGAARRVERGLRWAQRSDIADEAGQSYFDRYLQALGPWRGYSAELNTVAGAPEPLEHPKGQAYWYYPGTLLIRPGEWRPGLGAGTGELAALRRELLQTALATATPQQPQPLLALDHDVLSLLTPDERLGVFDTVLGGPALTSDMREDAVHLLTRVLLSTPDGDFPPLERKLTSGGALEKLLGGNAPEGKVLLGQVFTQKALASFPLVLDVLESLPTWGVRARRPTCSTSPRGRCPRCWWRRRRGRRSRACAWEPSPPCPERRWDPQGAWPCTSSRCGRNSRRATSPPWTSCRAAGPCIRWSG